MLGGHDGPVLNLIGPQLSRNAMGTNDPFGENAPFGITEVDADWRFDTWMEQNKMNPLVVRGLIYELKDNDPDHPELARIAERSPNVEA